MKSLKVIDLVLYVFGSLFENFTAQISLRDKKTRKSTLSDENWEKAESAIINCSRQRTKHSYRIWQAFLWSKVDFMVKMLWEDNG
jgi:hypothetical protein